MSYLSIYQPNERTIHFLYKLVIKLRPSVIMVDDGSGESCRDLFDGMVSLSTIVYLYPINRGKGYALKYGMREIQKKFSDFNWVVTIDGDGQHIIEDVEKALDICPAGPRKFILGVRSFAINTTPISSWIGNGLTNLLYFTSSGKWLSNTQNGLRKFSIIAIRGLRKINGDQFDYEMNQLLALPRKNHSLFTFPAKAEVVFNILDKEKFINR